MIKLKTIFIASLALGILACGNKPPHKEDENIDKAVLAPDFSNYDRSAETSIESVSIDADVMTLVVGYSGGCEKHEFALVGMEAVLKSLPPKRKVMLYHNNNGDSCREYLTDTLKFNIEPLGYEPGKEIELMLADWSDPIKYTLSK